MIHVIDDLELFVMNALGASEHQRVERHLAECVTCRLAANELALVVASLPDTVVEREPPPGLRDRILASARAESPITGAATAPGRAKASRRWLPVGALAAAVLVLAVISVGSTMRTQEMERDLATSHEIALRLSEGGRTWEMAGVNGWEGSGGLLVAPAGRPAYVVFRDLAPVPNGQRYAIWLVDSQSRWTRGTNFIPQGDVQLVEVGMLMDGYDRCAVTLEPKDEGSREGPMVMESRTR